MTWLVDTAEGESDWDQLSARFPEAFEALTALVVAAWEEADPVLLELARLRVAALLDNGQELGSRTGAARDAGLTEEKIAALGEWPSSPLYGSGERACLALAEQFVVDANGVTEEHVAAVSDHLGAEGCFAFVEAVSALETFQRACLTMGLEQVPGVDLMRAGSAPDAASEERPE